MKQLFSLLMLAGSLTLSAQPVSTDETWTPTIKFTQSSHDFGTIAEGPKVYHEFTFTNTGREPVVVQVAKAGCGCTTPEWSKAPVAPGKTGTIKVGFDSQGRPGVFKKEVDVTFAAGMNNEKTGTVQLTIKGDVKAQSKEAVKPASKPAKPDAPLKMNPVNKKQGS